VTVRLERGQGSNPQVGHKNLQKLKTVGGLGHGARKGGFCALGTRKRKGAEREQKVKGVIGGGKYIGETSVPHQGGGGQFYKQRGGVGVRKKRRSQHTRGPGREGRSGGGFIWRGSTTKGANPPGGKNAKSL